MLQQTKDELRLVSDLLESVGHENAHLCRDIIKNRRMGVPPILYQDCPPEYPLAKKTLYKYSFVFDFLQEDYAEEEKLNLLLIDDLFHLSPEHAVYSKFKRGSGVTTTLCFWAEWVKKQVLYICKDVETAQFLHSYSNFTVDSEGKLVKKSRIINFRSCNQLFRGITPNPEIIIFDNVLISSVLTRTRLQELIQRAKYLACQDKPASIIVVR